MCLQRVQGGKLRLWDPFLLEQDVEAFAHAFGIDERFELQAGARAGGFVHALVVKIREVISLP